MMRPELIHKLYASKYPDQVNLSHMGIVDDEIVDIMATLYLLKPQVSKIDLDDNFISDHGAERLAHALQNFTACKELSLQFNHIGEVGITALAQLKKNFFPNLHLCLHGNAMTNVFEVEDLMAQVLNSRPYK